MQRGRKEVAMLIILALAIVFSLLLALLNYLRIKKKPAGTDQMAEISETIRQGASEFLKCEFRILYIAAAGIFLVLAVFVSFTGAACFLIGAAMSALAGLVGMKSATLANVRVTNEARETRDVGRTVGIALTGGSVMGLSVAGFALLGLFAVYIIFGVLLGQLEQQRITFHANFLSIADIPFTMSVSCYALGCSVIAMINRVGGGIYTKAADMGADLVGKSEYNIPEDDPRNPATIADNVGDNVGDVAGLGSDLLESYVGAITSSMILAIYTYYSRKGASDAISHSLLLRLVGYPLLFCSIGLLCCTAALAAFNLRRAGGDAKKTLDNTTYLSSALTVGLTALATNLYLPQDIALGGIGFSAGRFSPWICAVAGIIAGILIGQVADYYTSYAHKPALAVAKASEEGPALTITKGMALGMNSVLVPVMILGLCIIAAHATAGLYGVGMAAMGMLSFVAVTVSVDTYGPISDNAGGIAEMCHLDKEVRKITDSLDAVGNTTAAIGKGFAIGSAAFAALSLFASYLYALAGEDSASGISLVLNILDPLTLAGALVGGALPYLFSGILIESVAKTAETMVDEIRNQFRHNPEILEGAMKPDYNRCIHISSKGALKEMKKPAFIAVVSPLVAGFVFGPSFVGGLLIGTTLSAIMLAIYTANSGGAWDNAKKHIEDGHFGGKGSDAHNASIIGDTVGDPLKDTVGPSLDILIKIMSVVALITVSIFSRYNIMGLVL